MVASKPKKPKKTGEEVSAEMRQRVALDRETEEEERRMRALSRRRLGASSLLAGLPGGPAGAGSGTGGSGSAIGGGGTSGGGGGGGGRGTGIRQLQR